MSNYPEYNLEKWRNFWDSFRQLQSSVNLPFSIEDKLKDPHIKNKLYECGEVFLKWSESSKDLSSYISVVVEQIHQGNKLSEQDMALIAMLPEITNSFRLKILIFIEKINFYLGIKSLENFIIRKKINYNCYLLKRYSPGFDECYSNSYPTNLFKILEKIKHKKSVDLLNALDLEGKTFLYLLVQRFFHGERIVEEWNKNWDYKEWAKFQRKQDSKKNKLYKKLLLVGKLLENGSRLNIPDENGNMLLHTAWQCRNHGGCYGYRLLGILIEKAEPSDLNLRDENGQTFFHLTMTAAGTISDTRIVPDALLDRGARVDIQDLNGNTPLHTAIISIYNNFKEPCMRDKILRIFVETLILKVGIGICDIRNKKNATIIDLLLRNKIEEKIEEKRIEHYYDRSYLVRELLIRLWVESDKLEKIVCLMKSSFVGPGIIDQKCQILEYFYQSDKSPPALLELYHATSEQVQQEWAKTTKEEICAEVKRWVRRRKINWWEYEKINALRQRISSDSNPDWRLKGLKQFLEVIIVPHKNNYSLPPFDRNKKQPASLQFLAFYTFLAKSSSKLVDFQAATRAAWELEWMETASRAFNNETRSVDFGTLVSDLISPLHAFLSPVVLQEHHSKQSLGRRANGGAPKLN